MNIITNNMRCVSKIICGALRNEKCITRGYALKSDLKIKWVHPGKVSCISATRSGDLGVNVEVSPNETMFRYDKSAELKDASEIVRKLFTLEFAPRKETVALRREKTLALVQRHKADRGSMESRIAAMTSEILQLQEYMQKFRKDKQSKVFLKELIEKRNKYLRYLRRWDYKRFEWLLEKLNLIYKPDPDVTEKLIRRECIRKLTTIHCDKIRQKKLDNYRNELEGQQKNFYKEKAQKLAFIREEEIACGVPVTVTEEEIENALQKAAELNK